MPNCPKCHRPENEGNSPNRYECTETDDEDGLCEAYAEIHRLRVALNDAASYLDDVADSNPDHWASDESRNNHAKEGAAKARAALDHS